VAVLLQEGVADVPQRDDTVVAQGRAQNVYTTAERSTFSAMPMSGTRMFMRLPSSASHPSRRIEG
jgi:hypothetical protein